MSINNEINVAVFDGKPFGLQNMATFLNRCDTEFESKYYYEHSENDTAYIICTDTCLDVLYEKIEMHNVLRDIIYCHKAYDELSNNDEVTDSLYLSDNLNLRNIVGISRDNDNITAADDKDNLFKIVLSNINGKIFNIVAKSTFDRNINDVTMFFNNCITSTEVNVKGVFGDPFEGMFVFAMDKNPRSLDKFTRECLFDMLSAIHKAVGIDNINDLHAGSLMDINATVQHGVRFVTVTDSWGNKYNLVRHNF